MKGKKGRENGQTDERERKRGGRGRGGGDDVIHFIVREGGQTSRVNTHVFSLFLRDAKTLNTDLGFQQMWQTDLIWHLRKEKRKEGGGQNSTSGFYQTKSDVESAGAA